MEREPVLVAQIVAAIMAVLGALVALGVVNLVPEQLSAVEQAIGAVLAVIVPLAATMWARAQVTPLADPRDDEGVKLQRVDGFDAVKR